jgi:membrane-associated phospholipid phosphatase
MAVLSAFQRLDDNQHWLSDVLMGAAIGIAVPYMFYKGEKQAKIDQGLFIPPMSISIPFNFPSGK